MTLGSRFSANGFAATPVGRGALANETAVLRDIVAAAEPAESGPVVPRTGPLPRRDGPVFAVKTSASERILPGAIAGQDAPASDG